MNFDDELARERKLNELLRVKLQESSARLESLRALANSRHDPYREALFREMDTVVSKSPAPQPSKAPALFDEPQPPTDQKPAADGNQDDLMKIVRFIGKDQKDTKELAGFLTQEGIQPKKAAKRVMFDLKKFGLFESFQYGRYRLTEKGLQALENQPK